MSARTPITLADNNYFFSVKTISDQPFFLLQAALWCQMLFLLDVHLSSEWEDSLGIGRVREPGHVETWVGKKGPIGCGVRSEDELIEAEHRRMHLLSVSSASTVLHLISHCLSPYLPLSSSSYIPRS